MIRVGAPLTWAYSFANSQVSSELAAQKIVFPAPGSAAIKERPPADAMGTYAGHLMTNGAQARTYADHFIAVHPDKSGGGKAHSQPSAASLANPTNAALAASAMAPATGDRHGAGGAVAITDTRT